MIIVYKKFIYKCKIKGTHNKLINTYKEQIYTKKQLSNSFILFYMLL